jgi:hypothetical protein
MNDQEQIIPIGQAARYSKKSKEWLKSMVAAGLLKNHGTSARPKFDTNELDQVISGNVRIPEEDDYNQTPGRAAATQNLHQAPGYDPTAVNPDPNIPAFPSHTTNQATNQQDDLAALEESYHQNNTASWRQNTRPIRTRSTWDRLEEEELEAPDPEDLYEAWRNNPMVWQPGKTSLFVAVREEDSNKFVPLNPNYLMEMPSYGDLCDRFAEGAIVKVAVKSQPNSKGDRKTIKGPLILMIAPRGEYRLSGYGNPWNPKGSDMGNNSDSKFWLNFLSDQNKLARQDNQQISNQWMSMLPAIASPKNDQGAIVAMMQQSTNMMVAMMQQQSAQQQRSSEQQMQMMFGMMQMMGTLAGNNKTDPEMFKAILESNKGSSEQTTALLTTVLQSALGKNDFDKQLELFAKFKELTDADTSTLGDIAKLIEASEIGPSLKLLAEGAAKRIGEPGTEEPAQINVAPPAGAAATPGAAEPPNPYATQTTPQAAAPPAVVDAQQVQVLTMVQEIAGKVAVKFAAGIDPTQYANEYYAENAEHKTIIGQLDPDQFLTVVQAYAAQWNLVDLASTAGLEYMKTFAHEVKRLATS